MEKEEERKREMEERNKSAYRVLDKGRIIKKFNRIVILLNFFN